MLLLVEYAPATSPSPQALQVCWAVPWVFPDLFDQPPASTEQGCVLEVGGALHLRAQKKILISSCLSCHLQLQFFFPSKFCCSIGCLQ